MPTLTVRDIPEDVYKKLRERAGARNRSMSAEVVTLIEEAVEPQRLDADTLVAEARQLYRFFPEPLPDLISQGKREGRK